MVKKFCYVGCVILGYHLIVVKDRGRKNQQMLDSNLSNKRDLKLYSKNNTYKGKR